MGDRMSAAAKQPIGIVVISVATRCSWFGSRRKILTTGARNQVEADDATDKRGEARALHRRPVTVTRIQTFALRGA